MLLLDWRWALTFMFGERNWSAALLRGGLILLLLPPFGWHVAMGYRRAVGMAALTGMRPLLPPLGLNCFSLFAGGFAASTVIAVYSMPSLVLFWIAGIHTASDLSQLVLPAIVFFAGVLALPPLAIPLLPPIYLHLFPDLSPSPEALAGCGLLFSATVFLLPAAFLNISRTGLVRSAYRIDRAALFIMRNPRLYCEAWALSLVATAVAILLGPFCPWGLFWSYLAILSAFNQALAISGRGGAPRSLLNSALVGRGQGTA